MKAHTALLERQAAVIQNTPHLRLQVRDGLFIVHVENLAGHHVVPVIDHGIVLLVIVRQVEHVIGEILTMPK